MSRTIFIGDVHGCYDELMELCDKIDLHDDDCLYFTGDLINKGPKSREVVEFVRYRPNTSSIIGNHEYFCINEFDDTDEIPHLQAHHRYWIDQMTDHFCQMRAEIADHREWLCSLPHVIETDDWILIHGGIHPEYGVETPPEISTLIRHHDGLPWYDHYQGDKPVIYGHWATDGLRIRHNTIGIDTGCVFGGHLTAYCHETGEIWQVRAHDIYKIPAPFKDKIGRVF